MLAFYRSGRQAEALETFRALRVRLAGELGVEPGSALQRLHRAMPAAEPARDQAAALVPAADVPAARVSAARDGYPPPAQLPADIAAFTGRAGARPVRRTRRPGRPGHHPPQPRRARRAGGRPG